MFPKLASTSVLQGRGRYDIIDLVKELWQGEPGAWAVLGAIVAFVTFLAAYQKVAGKSLVKSKRERREARCRRKHVIWEYKRDD
jgi:hypothetical protein